MGNKSSNDVPASRMWVLPLLVVPRAIGFVDSWGYYTSKEDWVDHLFQSP
jgi:hypothetical protein